MDVGDFPQVFLAVPVLGCVVKPGLGGLADRHGAGRAVLLGAVLTATLLYTALPRLPALPPSPTTSLHCGHNKVLRVWQLLSILNRSAAGHPGPRSLPA